MNAPLQPVDAAEAAMLNLLIAAPRGFCAGVDRAIEIVEKALERYGAPVYVRHEIVHNKYVVEGLKAKGAIFVDQLDEVPDDAPVVFSAHGVPKAVPAEARRRKLLYVDATCPLVSKVHIEAARHHENGLQMVMIGHAGHPETVGTMGQLPPGEVLLVETVEDVATLEVRDPAHLAFVTQTTLSVDDTADIVAALQSRFPAIVGPHKEDICYATTNRQEAVKAMAPGIDALLVIGSSLMIYSGYRFAVAAHGARKPLVIVNRGTTRADDLATHKLSGDCADILPRAIELMASRSHPRDELKV